jgi:hypothetical protein
MFSLLRARYLKKQREDHENGVRKLEGTDQNIVYLKITVTA